MTTGIFSVVFYFCFAASSLPNSDQRRRGRCVLKQNTQRPLQETLLRRKIIKNILTDITTGIFSVVFYFCFAASSLPNSDQRR